MSCRAGCFYAFAETAIAGLYFLVCLLKQIVYSLFTSLMTTACNNQLDFTPVPFMTRGKEPSNWADLCRFSSESSTEETVSLAKEWLGELPPESPKHDSSAKGDQGANLAADKEAHIGGRNSLASPFSPLARSFREEYHGKNGAGTTGKELVPDRGPRESPSNAVSPSGRRVFSDLGTRSRKDIYATFSLQPLCKRSMII